MEDQQRPVQTLVYAAPTAHDYFDTEDLAISEVLRISENLSAFVNEYIKRRWPTMQRYTPHANAAPEWTNCIVRTEIPKFPFMGDYRIEHSGYAAAVLAEMDAAILEFIEEAGELITEAFDVLNVTGDVLRIMDARLKQQSTPRRRRRLVLH